MCLFSLLTTLVVLFITLSRRRAKHTLYFLYMLLAIFVFTLGSVFEAAEPNDFVYLQVVRIQYLSIPFVAPFMLLFFMDFCKIRIQLWPHLLPLLSFPVAVALLSCLFPELMLRAIEAPHSTFRYFFFAYSYVVTLLAIFLAFFQYAKRDALFKKQTTLLVVAALLPMLGNFLSVFTDFFQVDITVLCLSASGVMVGYALLFGGLFQIAPMAREEIVENMRDGFILIDISGKFIDANKAAIHLFPQLKTLSVGEPLSHVEDIGGKSWHGHVFTRNGELGARHYRTSLDKLRHHGQEICHCITIYDVTREQEQLNETKKLAEYDALTGLMNRRTLFLSAKEKCAQIEIDGGEAFVLMMDLDCFKQVNDTYGHQAGDEVLQAVAQKLASRFRKTDLLARYGGEEFCALLPAAQLCDALAIAEECKNTIKQMGIPIKNGQSLQVSLSIGLAKYTSGCGMSFDTVVAQADAALYAAKEKGRNCCIFYNNLVKDIDTH